MPRYYFHIRDRASEPDETGTELPDISTAQGQAIRLCGEILEGMGPRFWTGTDWRLEVADEHGCILFVLHFAAEERVTLADPRPDPPAS